MNEVNPDPQCRGCGGEPGEFYTYLLLAEGDGLPPAIWAKSVLASLNSAGNTFWCDSCLLADDLALDRP